MPAWVGCLCSRWGAGRCLAYTYVLWWWAHAQRGVLQSARVFKVLDVRLEMAFPLPSAWVTSLLLNFEKLMVLALRCKEPEPDLSWIVFHSTAAWDRKLEILRHVCLTWPLLCALLSNRRKNPAHPTYIKKKKETAFLGLKWVLTILFDGLLNTLEFTF